MPAVRAVFTGDWMNARTRASFDEAMSTDKQPTGFRRQIVVRLDAEQWPLLASAVAEHGSIQRAVVAALHSLVSPSKDSEPATEDGRNAPDGSPATDPCKQSRKDDDSGDQEIT